MKKFKKIAVTLLKFSLSALLLYFVFKRIPFLEVWTVIKGSNFYLLILAFFCFLISQLISAERLWRFFAEIDYHFPKKENIKLYLIGMFYNFFIPGGIGGDAYKVYILHKKYDWRVKKLSAAVLIDRLSGLLAILVLIQIFSVFVIPDSYKILVIFPIAATIIISKLACNKFFPSFKHLFWRGLVFSFAVQILQLISIYFIVSSFTSVENIWLYFLVFLMSTVLSVLSFSGIGIREWVFMKAGLYLHYDVKISIAVAMIFTMITAVVSLFGISLQIKDHHWFKKKNL